MRMAAHEFADDIGIDEWKHESNALGYGIKRGGSVAADGRFELLVLDKEQGVDAMQGFNDRFPAVDGGASRSLDDGEGLTTQGDGKWLPGVTDFPEQPEALRLEFGNQQSLHGQKIIWSSRVVKSDFLRAGRRAQMRCWARGGHGPQLDTHRAADQRERKRVAEEDGRHGS